jgi:hypothetical protein
MYGPQQEKSIYWAGGVAQVIERLSSNSGTTKRKEKKQKFT